MIVLSSTGQGTPDATGVTVHWPSKYLYQENTDIFEALSLLAYKFGATVE